MSSLEMRADHRQNQTLSPRLQHAVRLLQVSSLDFAATVRDALGKNPFLEGEDAEDADPLPQEAADPQLAPADAEGEGALFVPAPLPTPMNGSKQSGGLGRARQIPTQLRAWLGQTATACVATLAPSVQEPAMHPSPRPRRITDLAADSGPLQRTMMVLALLLAVTMMSYYVHLLNVAVERGAALRASFRAPSRPFKDGDTNISGLRSEARDTAAVRSKPNWVAAN